MILFSFLCSGDGVTNCTAKVSTNYVLFCCDCIFLFLNEGLILLFPPDFHTPFSHALLMVKFSKDVLIKMKKLTRELDSSLGPDTSTLAMRVGIHSGPVTAGILRGEKGKLACAV